VSGVEHRVAADAADVVVTRAHAHDGAAGAAADDAGHGGTVAFEIAAVERWNATISAELFKMQASNTMEQSR
jgi:hypothetical protein